jgi:hypothetical protein
MSLADVTANLMLLAKLSAPNKFGLICVQFTRGWFLERMALSTIHVAQLCLTFFRSWKRSSNFLLSFVDRNSEFFGQKVWRHEAQLHLWTRNWTWAVTQSREQISKFGLVLHTFLKVLKSRISKIPIIYVCPIFTIRHIFAHQVTLKVVIQSCVGCNVIQGNIGCILFSTIKRIWQLPSLYQVSPRLQLKLAFVLCTHGPVKSDHTGKYYLPTPVKLLKTREILLYREILL